MRRTERRAEMKSNKMPPLFGQATPTIKKKSATLVPSQAGFFDCDRAIKKIETRAISTRRGPFDLLCTTDFRFVVPI